MQIRETYKALHSKAELKVKTTHIRSSKKKGRGVKKVVFREYPNSFCDIEVDGVRHSLGMNQWIFIQLLIKSTMRGEPNVDGRRTMDRIGCASIYPFQLFKGVKSNTNVAIS